MGVGSLKPEFDLLGLGGAEFSERGERGDDALRAIRASFSKRMPEYHGSHYDFSDFIIDPCGVQEHVPIWIGGRSARSLRRAVELGDGWAPFGLSVADMAKLIEEARRHDAWQLRTTPLECALPCEAPLDALEEPGRAAEQIGSLVRAGATKIIVRFDHRSRSHFIEQMEALAQLQV